MDDVILGKVKTEQEIAELIETIINVANSESNKAQEEVISLVANGDSFVIEALIKLLGNKNKAIRFWAADTLGYYATSNQVVDLLIEKLKNGTDNEREAAVYALAYHKGKKIIASLISSLKDEASEVRHLAVTGLGEIGDNSALPALKELYLTESVGDVKEAILIAINYLELKN